MTLGGERKTEDSKSSSTTESVRMSGDKGKSSDERVFAVISTPRSSQPASDQVQQVQAAGVAESKPSVKVEPTVIRLTQEEPLSTAGQTQTRGQDDGLPVQAGRQQAQQVDQKAAESSKPEPALSKAVPPTSRTDPARLHKLVNQRIEEVLTSKQEESTTTTTTTSHEVKKQFSKTTVSAESTTASTRVGVAQEEGGTPRTRIGSEPTERTSTEQNNILEAAETTRTDVRQVGVGYNIS